jgi:hypothetical protein
VRRRLAAVDAGIVPAPTAEACAAGADGIKRLLTDDPPAAPRAADLSPARPPDRTAPPVRPHRGLAVACLALGCGAVLFFGGPGDRLQVGPTATHNRPTDGENSRHERLVGQMVDHYLALAATPDPAVQAEAFAGMSDDLSGEAVRLARDGPPEHLAFVAQLHERALRWGVLRRVVAVPRADRAARLPALLQTLRRVEHTLTADPALRPLADATRETLAAIEAGDARPPADEPDRPPAPPAGLPPALSLVAALVNQGLLVAEEDNPLVRAYASGDLADRVNLTSMVYSLRGERELALSLNHQAQRVVEQGATNAARMAPADPRVRDVERLLQRTRQTVEALEGELARADGGATFSDARTKALEKDLKDLAKSFRDLSKEPKRADGKDGKDVKDGKKKK